MSEPRIIVYVPPPAPARIWMITLADLLSLLLTFFVLLFSMMEMPDENRWKPSASTLEQAASGEEPVRTLVEGDGVPLAMPVPVEGKNLDYLRHILERQLKNSMTVPLAYTLQPDRLVISLSSDIYFIPGSADIQPQAEKLLHDLGGLLAVLPNRIVLEGHTDPRPLKHASFPDNWTLSLARAGAVAYLLQESGVVSPLRIYGRADGAFDEIPADGTLQDRYKKSRRVDIVIHALEK